MRDELRESQAQAGNVPRAFDVFLSHNGRDKPVVERIARRLRDGGIEPWLDIWHLTPGGRWQEELAAGLAASRACAVFIGSHDLGNWELQELGVALDRAAKERDFRLFPVLLPGLSEPFDPSALPPFLATRTWVDFREGWDEPRRFQGLVNAVRGVPLGAGTARGPRRRPAALPRPRDLRRGARRRLLRPRRRCPAAAREAQGARASSPCSGRPARASRRSSVRGWCLRCGAGRCRGARPGRSASFGRVRVR